MLADHSQEIGNERPRRRRSAGKATGGIASAVRENNEGNGAYKQSERIDVELPDVFAETEAMLRWDEKCNAMRRVFVGFPVPASQRLEASRSRGTDAIRTAEARSTGRRYWSSSNGRL
jgi:hypothetical protein